VGGIAVAPLANDFAAFERGKAVVDAAAADVDTTGLCFPMEWHALCGLAGPAIIDVATGAGLIVAGSRGRGGFAGVLLESTSHYVVHHAWCPVVLLPPVD